MITWKEQQMNENSGRNEFSNRFMLIISVLGIAIGTGNIWRFPRIAAQNGGAEGAGAFLVSWIIFLFLWSIPLIVAEYALGRSGRLGPAGTFAKLLGPKYAWRGGFVGIVAMFIMFYYSVVTGWCFYYLASSINGNLNLNASQSLVYWNSFQNGYWPLILHITATVFAGIVVSRGVKIIERVNVILVPSLAVILLISLARSVSLDGSWVGISYLFTIEVSQFTKPEMWLEALTQNAWDTGAGWGLIICYAAYARSNDAINKSAIQTGLGNNLISLIAAVIIFSTVFALLGKEMSKSDILGVMKSAGPASTGLTFIWMPQLFNKMNFGGFFQIIFFLGLSMAAFSSLISMLELSSRMFEDFGFKRKQSAQFSIIAGGVLGIPSALSLEWFSNQDFVWGLGLMISGAMISSLIIKYGAGKFLRECINVVDGDLRFGNWWPNLMNVLIPLQVVVLLGWWIWRSAVEFSPETWYDPFSTYSVATCFMQWVIMGYGIFLLYRRHPISP